MSESMTDQLAGRMMVGRAAAAAAPLVVEGIHGPGLVHRGMSIHQSEDPVREASNWVGQALSRRGARQSGPPALALVMGLGLGWHLRILKQMRPDMRVAVYEPDRSLIDVYGKYNVLGRGQEPEIYHDFGEFEAMVAREVVHSEDAGSPVVLTVPGYASLWPREAARFADKVGMEISRREVIDKTKLMTSSAVMENLARNAGLAAVHPDLAVLRGRLPIRPAFVVGAGPSLARNGRALGEVGGKGFILCAAAALKPLLGLGVRPDVVLVLESSDTSGYLRLDAAERAILGDSAILAAASSAHPAHFGAEGFRKALFHLGGGEAQLLGQGLFLPQGGNAGTACFALAWMWGLSPLVLVGQDQAYEGDLLHAPGTADSVVEDNFEGLVTVDAVGGGTVTTNTSLLASINWYVEAALAISRKERAPRLINASAGGAAIRGFEEMALGDVLARLGEPPAPLDLPRIVEAIPRPSAKEIRRDLKQMSGLLSSLKRLLQADFHRCLAEMVNTSRASAFMAQILAPAMAAGHKTAALRQLIWADGIILKMLSSL
jgi:hypothetical protein